MEKPPSESSEETAYGKPARDSLRLGTAQPENNIATDAETPTDSGPIEEAQKPEAKTIESGWADRNQERAAKPAYVEFDDSEPGHPGVTVYNDRGEALGWYDAEACRQEERDKNTPAEERIDNLPSIKVFRQQIAEARQPLAGFKSPEEAFPKQEATLYQAHQPEHPQNVRRIPAEKIEAAKAEAREAVEKRINYAEATNLAELETMLLAQKEIVGSNQTLPAETVIRKIKSGQHQYITSQGGLRQAVERIYGQETDFTAAKSAAELKQMIREHYQKGRIIVNSQDRAYDAQELIDLIESKDWDQVTSLKNIRETAKKLARSWWKFW